MGEKLVFEIDDIKLIQEFSDNQLAIAEVFVANIGNNKHDKPISLEAMKAATPTLINKFLVAGFDGYDFQGHEGKKQRIIGFFPKENDFRFVEKDGKTYFVANAIISKIYATWAFDIFKRENYKECSMEISILKEENINEKVCITSFVFNGVTVLGNWNKAACEGSGVEIVKFSTDNMIAQSEKAYQEYLFSQFQSKDSVPPMLKMWVEQIIQEQYNKDQNKEGEKMHEENFEDQIEDKEEEMSSDAYIDPAAQEEMLEKEAEQNKEIVEESEEEQTEEMSEDANSKEQSEDEEKSVDESADEEMAEEVDYKCKYEEKCAECSTLEEKCSVYMSENEQLKQFKFGIEEQMKNKIVESAIADVMTLFSAEQIDIFREDAKQFTFENINSWENKLKAEAFDIGGKKKNKDDITVFALPNVPEKNKNTSNSVWERIGQ